jgi:CRISPR-associated protein Cas1
MEFVAISSEADDADWASRNEHWLTGARQRSRYRSKRERRRDPLILCGHGVSLRIDRGTVLINDGFTHYPQERRTYRFFKGGLDLPPRIVMLDGSGSLSFDVITWLSEQNLPLIRADYRGEVASVIGGDGFAADPERLRWQVETRTDPNRRLEFCCGLIAEKLRASLVTLREVIPESRSRQLAIAAAEAGIHTLTERRLATVDQVRELEMRAASAYFTAWRGVTLKWRSRWKHPIPDDWLTVGSRRSMRRPLASNRNATHPINAILNYGYAMLQSHVHVAAVGAGFDPRRGVLHHDREDDRSALSFVFDMMEPGRPIVDAAVLRFLRDTELTGADFAIRADGVCRLAPQLARRVCEIVASNQWYNPANGLTAHSPGQ